MTTPAKQTLREGFDRDFKTFYEENGYNTSIDLGMEHSALWAARWMANYIAENILTERGTPMNSKRADVRQLAKELDQ